MEFERKRVDTREEQRVVVVEAIVGADVEVIPFSRSHRTWRPERMTITIERYRTDGGPWSPWRALHLAVDGRGIRQGGEDGAERRQRGSDYDRTHPLWLRAGAVAAGFEADGMPAAMIERADEPEPADLDG